MGPRPSGRLAFAGLVPILFLVCASPSSAQDSRTPRGYTGTLAEPRVSVADDGRIVISMDAAGELRGLMTLDLEADGAGGLKGQWALKVAYLQDLNADGSVATEVVVHEETPGQEDSDHHREYVRFVNEGAVNGTVSGVVLRYADDGSVAGLDSAQLIVDRGNVTFDGATGGGEIVTNAVDPHGLLLSLNF